MNIQYTWIDRGIVVNLGCQYFTHLLVVLFNQKDWKRWGKGGDVR